MACTAWWARHYWAWAWALMLAAASAASAQDAGSAPSALPIPLQTRTLFTDWGLGGGGGGGGGRNQQPVCVDIPSNLSLCYGVGYKQMRLPNLLEHDTMTEVGQQAASWVPLVSVRCHGDAQLFLCSLFSPVCLERSMSAIFPCRSLCEAVRAGCEGRMRAYGYPWPDMFRCDKFPLDNDMCIASQTQPPPGPPPPAAPGPAPLPGPAPPRHSERVNPGEPSEPVVVVVEDGESRHRLQGAASPVDFDYFRTPMRTPAAPRPSSLSFLRAALALTTVMKARLTLTLAVAGRNVGETSPWPPWPAAGCRDGIGAAGVGGKL